MKTLKTYLNKGVTCISSSTPPAIAPMRHEWQKDYGINIIPNLNHHCNSSGHWRAGRTLCTRLLVHAFLTGTVHLSSRCSSGLKVFRHSKYSRLNLASRNKIFISGTITALFIILSSVNSSSVVQAESHKNFAEGKRHLAVISEQSNQQLELIDAGTPLPPPPPSSETATGQAPPLPEAVRKSDFPNSREFANKDTTPSSVGIFQKLTNLTVLITGDITKQTAGVASSFITSVTDFLSNLFRDNKSSAPQTIVQTESPKRMSGLASSSLGMIEVEYAHGQWALIVEPPPPSSETAAGQASANEDFPLPPPPPPQPTIGGFQKFSNLVTSLATSATRQTASILSSITGFFTDLFTNKPAVPETIIPIKQSGNEPTVKFSNDESSSSEESKFVVDEIKSPTSPTSKSSSSKSSVATYNLPPKTYNLIPSITRNEVLNLIQQSKDNNQSLLNSLITVAKENSLSLNQSVSDLEKKISAIQSNTQRQLDKPGSTVSRTDADIQSVTNASITGATITTSSFSGTTGDFSGDVTISGILTAGTTTLTSLTVTSTTATSTFAGRLLATKAPTLPHTFSVWDTDAINSNVLDSSFLINPSSAVADSNIFGIAVGGNVKFLVDAEGDVFVRNLTATGTVNQANTNISTLTVENATILGDADTDALTIRSGIWSLTSTATSTVAMTNGLNFDSNTFVIDPNSNRIGIGTSSPYAKLSVVGAGVFDDFVRASYFTATSTTATSTFPYLSVTTNSNLGTVVGGTWQGTAIGSQYGGTGINSSALTGLAQIVAGTWSASSTLSTAFGGTGWNSIATGYIPFGNATAPLATSSSFYWDNGNSRLGIGTSMPDSKLTVFANADDSAIEFSSASGSTYKWTMGMDYSDAGKFKIASSTALGSIDRFTIDGRGYVGIGTSTPATRLDVADSGNNNAQMRLSRESDVYTNFNVAQTTGDLALSLYGANANDVSLLMPDGSTGANLWVCEGAACPSGISFTGGGNLFVEGVIKYATSTTPKTRRSIILTAAGAIVPTASGAAKTQVDGTNHSYYVLDFDASSDEAAYWQWTMPDSYDDGAIDITYYWEAGATSGDSIFCFQAKGLSANSSEDIDSALSSAVCETDTAQANANDLASMTETDATSNFTAGEYATFKVFRDADAGGDTMTGDARLVKVKIEYGVATESD